MRLSDRQWQRLIAANPTHKHLSRTAIQSTLDLNGITLDSSMHRDVVHRDAPDPETKHYKLTVRRTHPGVWESRLHVTEDGDEDLFFTAITEQDAMNRAAKYAEKNLRPEPVVTTYDLTVPATGNVTVSTRFTDQYHRQDGAS